MSKMQTPMSDQTFAERFVALGERVVEPHRSITDPSQKRRARLLNAATLLLAILFFVGLLAAYRVVADFSFALAVLAAAFILGKSKYPRGGVFLFSLGALSIAYILLYSGYVINYSPTVLIIVPIALAFVNALTSQKTFAGFAAFAVLAAFLAPYYSQTPILPNEVIRAGGALLAISVVLYVTNAIRASVEKAYAQEIDAQNQQIQNSKAELENLTEKSNQENEIAAREIQERVTRLKVLSELSQEIAANVNKKPKDLLTYIAEILSQQLGYYHVGIFLLDKKREYAELYAANSEGGQRMLERRHQLKVGGAGIVGYASQSGYPRIALSTGADAVFFNNPDLPETRSEMALPLKIANQVVGVLDVQSPLPAAFSEDDVNSFTTLSNQIALVIQNIQTGELAAAGLSLQSGKISNEFVTRQEKKGGYVYLADGTLASAQTVHSPILEKALNAGKTLAEPSSSKTPVPVLAIPVKIREDVIGYIYIEAAEADRKWSEDETLMAESISERAALALENARLFEETERRAKQEEIMAHVTSRIGETTQFERILQTTIQEIGRTLGAKRAFIELASPAAHTDSAQTDRGT